MKTPRQWAARLIGGGSASAAVDFWMPSGAVAENMSRLNASTGISITSGFMRICGGATLTAGATVTNVNFVVSGFGIGPLNQWAVLLDKDFKVLAKTADKTTEAWANNIVKTYTFTSPYVSPSTQPVYVGVVAVFSSGNAGFYGNTVTFSLSGIAPVYAINSTSSSYTNPSGITVGSTIATSGNGTSVPYFYLT